jgi:hypothetical protein
MDIIKKALSALLILVLAFSILMMVKPASAQTIPNPTLYPGIPKPSVPEFTLQFTAHPYDVPTVIDQKTGAIVAPAYRDDNQTIIITIKNQPLNPGSNETYNLFYFVRAKNHSSSIWTETYPYLPNRYSQQRYLPQSDSEFTVIYYYGNHPIGSQLDFQVEAILQNLSYVFVNNLLPGFPAGLQPDNYGEQYNWIPIASSDWSNTQTISITDGSVSISTSPTPNPTPTTSVPEFSWLMLLPLFLSLLSIAVLIAKRKFSDSHG